MSGGALLTFGFTLFTCLVVVVFISWFAMGDNSAVGAALRWFRFITVDNVIRFMFVVDDSGLWNVFRKCQIILVR